ncbi:polysaccharide deacetylase family protein [Thioalkalivibrio sp. ALJT]|uniref:polysaccharide deacetylase family protein n=1 Tax=Thioalkalivibrio sp. ALJT TaxID=1158146 RepID=UPI00036AC5C8|nr:polysaccharide deacetylase family protein [Thioalkalivibrio sp. ALJT]
MLQQTALFGVQQLWPWVQPGQRLSILLYHQVLPTPDPLRPDAPDTATFDWQMELLSRHSSVLALPEALHHLETGTLPPRATAITFDDGYADNRLHALPVLQRHGLPATFFIAAGYLNGGRMFNDTLIETIRRAPNGTLDLGAEGLGTYTLSNAESRRQAIRDIIREIKWRPRQEREGSVEAIARHIGADLPDDLMMTDQQVRELAEAGMTIGGHTLSHPILAQEDARTAATEIAQGRQRLQAITGQSVDLFAYPNGRPGQDYTARDVGFVRDAGFSAAVSTSMGSSAVQSDRFQLPRFTPWSRNPVKFLAQLVRNTRHPVTVV